MKFLETIKVKNGNVCSLKYHEARFSETCTRFFGAPRKLPALDRLEGFPLNGLYKARVVYDAAACEVEFIPYEFRKIGSLKIVDAALFDYSYKSCDRRVFEELVRQKGGADEIIITINGFVFDTSYSNLVFEKDGKFFTPETFLLNGTKRRALLDEGKITATAIRAADIFKYDAVRLINAMIDLEDNVRVPVSQIV